MDVTSLISHLGQDLNISVPVIVVIGDKDSGVCPEITDNNQIYKDIHYLTKMFAAAKDAEINLVVEKKGLPDLIIVDLPHVNKNFAVIGATVLRIQQSIQDKLESIESNLLYDGFGEYFCVFFMKKRWNDVPIYRVTRASSNGHIGSQKDAISDALAKT
ncbi:hypothetical protein Tco_1372879 [Tanacetum coccineum]